MRISHLIFGPVMAVLMAAFLPSLSVAQAPQFEQPDKPIKMMVVSITSQRHDGKIKNGFGFVIGLSGSIQFIVTANHVLRAPGSEYPPRSITVRYAFLAGKPFEAKAQSLYDGANDIGLIAAKPFYEYQKLYDPEPADCPSNLQPGDKLWYVGRGGDWYIPTDPALFTGFDGNGRIVLEKSDATEGSSGAPLVTTDGVVGMIVSGQGTGSAMAASIEDIRRLVDGKILLEDGTLVDEAWRGKELGGVECEMCERWRVERPAGDQEYCPWLDEPYCAKVHDQGFPTHKHFNRLKFEMPRSCGCVPEHDPPPPTTHDDDFPRFPKFHESDLKSDLKQYSCASTALRDLFGQRMRAGGLFGPILDQFRPSALDFKAIFHRSHVKLAQRGYADEVKRHSMDVMEAEFDPSMVHLPKCLRWPAGLGRSFGSGNRIDVQPRQSVIYCTVVYDNPIGWGDKQIQEPGFFYVNGRWVWMSDLENWGR